MYFLPRDGYFEVAFVFGQKATDMVVDSNVDQEIKNNLLNARKYAEGRGVKVVVKNETVYNDIKKLINIKMEN
jgi:uncharacterized protein DUF3788